jgi:hypothetical protein
MFALMNSVYAYTGFGVCNYGKESIPSVICYGPTVMKETHVAGDIKVTGSLQAENISTRGIQVEGTVNLSNAQVSGAVNVTGDFSADHVQFAQGVAVTGTQIILSNTKVNGLMTITSDKDSPTLQVLCNSTITGSVLFSGKAGVIQVTDNSSIQGKVVNGSMQFVKYDCRHE